MTARFALCVDSGESGSVADTEQSASIPAPSVQAHDGDLADVAQAAEPGLRDVWGDLAPARQASCWAWLAFLVTWVITRLITHHGKSDGSAAIIIAGHHIHHYLMGMILISITAAVAIFIKPERWWQLLGIGYGIALALILDEYALLLNLSDVYWESQGRLSVTIVLTVISIGGVYVAGMTWFNESLRRGGRRVRQSRPYRHDQRS
jgi:hypothetical protein